MSRSSICLFTAVALLFGIPSTAHSQIETRTILPPEPTTASIPEEFPAWNLPDLAVTQLRAEPQNPPLGEEATLLATVRNLGPGPSRPARVEFWVGQEPAGEASFGSLDGGVSALVQIAWTVEERESYRLTARLILDPEALDFRDDNHRADGMIYVQSPDREGPHLRVEQPRLDPPIPVPGEPASIRFSLANLGAEPLERLSVFLRIDDEAVFDQEMDGIEPGERRDLVIPWTDVLGGHHSLGLVTDVPRRAFPEDVPCTDWSVVIPEKTVIYDTFLKDKWVSIGPEILSDESVGRMDRIAIDPTDTQVLYAGAPGGGLWKSIDAGMSWNPLTDKLPHPRVGAVALDPQNTKILYLGSGHSFYGGAGIFKSIDGGVSWRAFATQYEKNVGGTATRSDIGGISDLIVRYTPAGDLVIYATTGDGVLRHRSPDPLALSSNPADWDLIKTGIAGDLVVHPDDADVLYAPIYELVVVGTDQKRLLENIYRTTKALTAGGDTDWQAMTGLPPKSKQNGHTTLDIWRQDPKVLYAAIYRDGYTRVFSTQDGGDNWKFQFNQKADYNDYIRIHPNAQTTLFFGGVKLYTAVYDSSAIFPWIRSVVSAGHVDQKTLEFVPSQPTPFLIPLPPFPTIQLYSDEFYALNDGGVYFCDETCIGSYEHRYWGWMGAQCLTRCNSRNRGLRTTQFFDIDASPTDPRHVIGGTQDNGTVLSVGQLVWRQIKGGDGNYSLIGPGPDPIMYGQHQCLNDDWGMSRKKGLGGGWRDAKNGLPKKRCWGKAQIALHPKDSDTLISEGDQVYLTNDGGKNWNPVGPPGKNGDITRVSFQPGPVNRWLVGTAGGQIWERGNAWVPAPIYEHPDKAAVHYLAFAYLDPRVLYAVFSGGRSDARIIRLVRGEDGWSAVPIADNFPCNLKPLSIAGDGHRPDVAYAGTDRGVYRWDASRPKGNRCVKPPFLVPPASRGY